MAENVFPINTIADKQINSALRNMGCSEEYIRFETSRRVDLALKVINAIKKQNKLQNMLYTSTREDLLNQFPAEEREAIKGAIKYLLKRADLFEFDEQTLAIL